MATKRRKLRKSCKNGKLKRPVRTRKGGKRRCKKTRKKTRKSKRKKFRMQYDNLPRDDKIELIDRMSIKDLLIFSKTSKENNALVKRRIRLIRNDLASNGLRQQEIDDILLNKQSFINFIKDNRINEVRVILKYFPEYINIADLLGNTPLMYASEKGHTEIVRLLLQRGAGVNAKTKFDGYKTALSKASEKGHTEIVRMLIEKGADVNIKSNDGNTALQYAIKQGHTEIEQLLIHHGATQ